MEFHVIGRWKGKILSRCKVMCHLGIYKYDFSLILKNIEEVKSIVCKAGYKSWYGVLVDCLCNFFFPFEGNSSYAYGDCN